MRAGQGAKAAICFLLLLTVSCGHSRQIYLDKGNQYFAAGKYEDAELNYQKAIQKDEQFGEAFYRIGLTEIKRGELPKAYRSLETATQLLPARADVQVALADLVLGAYILDKRRPASFYQQLTKLSNQLLDADPNSFDGLRIKGSLAWLDGRLKEASDIFSQANALRPYDPKLTPMWTEVLFLDRRFEEGERLAREFVEKHKDTGAIYDILYTHYLAQKRPAEAEDILKAKVRNNPAQIDYALQLASHYASRGQREQMSAVLRSISDPARFPETYLKLGDFYSSHQSWPEALREYEQGAKADPQHRPVYLERIAGGWLAQGKGEEAAGVADEILKGQPANETARAAKASYFLKSGQVEESLDAFRELVKSNPNNGLWRFNLGRALAAKGDLDAARAQFEESLKRRPDFMPARLALADVSRRKHEYADTLRYSNEVLAVKANAKLLPARLLQAAGWIGTRQYAQASSSLADLEREYPQSREVQYQLADLDLSRKNYTAAIARLLKLYADGKGDPHALAVLVDAYRGEGRLDQALALLKAEAAKSPDSAPVRALLADTALNSGDYDLALEHYGHLLAKGVRSEQLQMRVGAAYESKGDYAQAVESFQKAKDMAPRDGEATAAWADALRLAGREHEAVTAYRAALALDPENPKRMNSLAFILASSGGKLDEADSLVEQALRRQPQDPDFRDTLGLVYLKKNLKSSAVSIFERLVEANPDNPLYRYHLALAHIENGEKAKAKTELEAALPKIPVGPVRRNIETTLAKLR